MLTQAKLERSRRRLEVILNGEIDSTLDAFHRDFFLARQSSSYKKCTPQEIIENQIRRYQAMVYIRRNHPKIIGMGEHQITLDIGGGLVAKSSSCFGNSGGTLREEKEIDSLSIFPFEHVAPLGRVLLENIHSNTELLKKLGFPVEEVIMLYVSYSLDSGGRIMVSEDPPIISLLNPQYIPPVKIEVPPDHEVYMEPQDFRLFSNFYITRDLRERGRYTVSDFTEEQAKTLVNGEEIISQYKRLSEQLLNYYKNHVAHLMLKYGTLTGKPMDFHRAEKVGDFRKEEPELEYDPHFSDHTIDDPARDAIRRTFLLQIPTDNKEGGKLVMGDLDHITLFYAC